MSDTTTETYFARNLKPGMSLIRGGGVHLITEVDTLELCNGVTEVVKEKR